MCYANNLNEKVMRSSPILKRIIASLNPILLFSLTVHAQPATQASEVTFESVESGQFTVRFTKGDGEKRALFIKEASSGTVAPTDSVTYIPSSTFGTGTQIGTSGWFCVLNGTDSVVTITGLVAYTDYTVMATEYNGIEGEEKYLTSTGSNNPATQTTGELSPPDVPTTGLTASNVTSYSAQLSWVNGSGQKRIVLMKLTESTTETPSPTNYTYYTPYSKFGLGAEAGTGWFCVFNGTVSNTSVDSLLPDTTYRVAIIDYNGEYQKEVYKIEFTEENIINFTTPKLEPPGTQTQSISSNILRPNSLYFNINEGSGENRAVFITDGTDNAITIQDSVTYTASQNYGLGTEVNGWYCVSSSNYRGSKVEGLQPETVYRMVSFEFNGQDGKQRYNHTVTSNNMVSFTTGKAAPTTQVTGLSVTNVNDTASVTWTPGNGESTIVFVKQTSSETFTPDDFSNYYATTSCLTNIESDWECVYNGSGSSFELANLPYDATFRFLAFSYNNDDYAETHNNSITNGENQYNYTTPTYTDAFSEPNGYITVSMLATRTNIGLSGSCNSKTVWIKETSSTTDYPTLVDGTVYSGDTVFGQGDQVGTGWYCLYAGRKSYIRVTGLTPQTDYRVYVCNYVNETASNTKYNNTHADGVNAITDSTLNNVLYGASSVASGWDPASIPATGDDIYVLSGAQFVGDQTFNNVTLMGTPELHGAGLTINGEVDAGANQFYLYSGSALIHNTANVTATYEKNLETGTWNPFSTPFTESFTSNSTDLYMKAFDEKTAKDWQYVQSLAPGRGAIVWNSSNTIYMYGTLNVADKNTAITYTPGYSYSGFNLLGNPFMANLDWNHESWDKTGLSSTYWIFKPTEGNYASYNGLVGTLGANQYIPATASFWIKTTVARTLKLPREARSVNEPGFKSGQAEEIPLVRLKANGNNYVDEAIVAFEPDAQMGMDDFDAEKFEGSLHAPQLYTVIGEDRLSLNYLPQHMLASAQAIPVYFTCTKAGEYQLDVSAEAFSTSVKVTLMDQKEGVSYELAGAVNFSFTYDTNDEPNRFLLAFENSQAVDIPRAGEPQTILYAYGRSVYVVNPGNNKGRLHIYNLAGQKIKQVDNIPGGLSQFNLSLKGLYIAVFEADTHWVKQKIVLMD